MLHSWWRRLTTRRGKRNTARPAKPLVLPRRRLCVETLEDRRVPATVFAVTTGDQLISFDSAAPGTLLSQMNITGIPSGDRIEDIDFRPATGTLYALARVLLGGGNQLYTVNRTTGAATAVGTPFIVGSSPSSRMDFDPTTDRLAVHASFTDPDVGTSFVLVTVNPDTGAVLGQVTLTTNTDDGIAFTNNVPNATSTALFGIGFASSTPFDRFLRTINTANGQVNDVGRLSANPAQGFDIGADGVALTALPSGNGGTDLNTVNLATGAATPVGQIGSSTITLRGLSVLNNYGTIAFGAATANVLENAGAVTLTLTRTGGSDGAVRVLVSTIDGTATAGEDYTALTGQTVTFGNGQTSQTVVVSILDDQVVEPDETFAVRLTNPAGQTLGTATVTIQENDVGGTIQFDPAAVTAAENGGPATITVTRTGGNVPVKVTYTTADGTATAGADYTATTGTLTFSDSDTSLTIVVPVLDDQIVEPNETFSLTLTDPTNGATLGSATTATVTIQENDLGGVIQFDPSSYTVAENGGPAILTVTRTGGNVRVEVTYTTANGTALAGSDYTATTGTLTFGASDTSKTIAVPLINDGIGERNEGFSLILAGPTNGATLGSAATAGVTIQDDDTPTISIGDASVTEGNVGTTPATFTVTLSNPSSLTVTVNYATANGSATAGTDYNPASGLLTFAPGTTSRTVVVGVLGDETVESDETFFVDLLPVATDATIGDGQGTGTILNEDKGGVVTFDPVTYSADEVTGAGGDVAVTVTATRAGGNVPVTVTYDTADGTATGGADYAARSGTLTFAAAETTKTIVIPILDDQATEPNETFQVRLVAFTNGASAGAASSAGVTILDDDTADRLFVRALYCKLLERSAADGNFPSNIEIEFWVGLLRAGTSRAQVAFGIASSRERRGAVVNEMYRDFFGRERGVASGEGEFWVDQLMAGRAEFEVAADLLLSPEFAALNPGDAGFVQGVYRAVLGAGAFTPSEVAFTLSLLQSGARTRRGVALDVLALDATYESAIRANYREFLGRDPDAGGAAFWLRILQDGNMTPTTFSTAILGTNEFFNLSPAIAAECAALPARRSR